MNFELPDLAELSDDQLSDLASAIRSDFEALASTVELSADDVTVLEQLTEAADEVAAEVDAREAVAAKTAKVDAMKASFAAKAAKAVELAEEVEAAPVVAETEEVVEDETLTASITPKGLQVPEAFAPAQAMAYMTAAAEVPGFSAGSKLDGMAQLVKAFMSKNPYIGASTGNMDGVRFLIASAEAAYPEDRALGDDAGGNIGRIANVVGPKALVAAGGLCAPLEPYYALEVVAGACRPVRDALPSFRATRGGIKHLAPPTLADLAGGVTVVSAACDNNTPCNPTTGAGPIPCKDKACIHVCCGTETDCVVSAISRCVTFGNFAARTYPEQVEAWLQLSMAAHARTAEINLLDGIDAASIQVTAAAAYGAVSTLLGQIDAAVASYKSRHRICGATRLRILLPDWVKALLRVDFARMQFNPNMSVTDAQILSYLRDRNVEPSFYIDSATGAGQIFGTQAAGALLTFPPTVKWYLFAEGTFLFLDGGTLDLGLVRDSLFNAKNDYSIFAETFEGVCKVGLESLAITSSVCANGTLAPAGAALTCPVA